MREGRKSTTEKILEQAELLGGGFFFFQVRKLRILDSTPIAANVEDGDSQLVEVTTDEVVAMALGWIFFTAHDRQARLAADLEQLVDPLAKESAGHHGRIIYQVEEISFSIGQLIVFIAGRVFGTAAEGFAKVLVVDPGQPERVFKGLAVELGYKLRIGRAADVEQHLDLEPAQQVDNFAGGDVAVADGENCLGAGGGIHY